MAHLEKVINDHADMLENHDVSEEIIRGRVDNMAVDVANSKAIIAQAGENNKKPLEENDAMLKESMATSIQALWDFFAQNNAGIAKMFQNADAALVKLAVSVEASKAALLQPSSVAAGPNGFAFTGLRAELKKSEQKVNTRFTDVQGEVNELKANVNAATMAAGAAGPEGEGTGGAHAIAELDKLEEAMEDRFALLQVQVESLSLSSCP